MTYVILDITCRGCFIDEIEVRHKKGSYETTVKETYSVTTIGTQL